MPSQHENTKVIFTEGIVTIMLGIMLCFVFPTDPEKTRYLTPEERELTVRRIYVDQPQITETKEKMSLQLIKRGMFHWCALGITLFSILARS